ncbi:hypothetical protein BGZ96_004714 [Linnemannia gamsii]|uniref:Uncharacterized protein n=1 Tax=Linnemannia gamsii TaxID=64522 RepID=A0ABQ7K6H9_9FUNG|nr:hypothetical protein BGZ96_004714 [Linnemannia gamsii]
MGEHHSDTTTDAASPSAVSLNKNTSEDDLSSYIGGSLSPSFKAKVMISDNHSDSNNNAAEDRDVDMSMEGVELEVTLLTVQSTTTTTTTSTFPQPPQQQLMATTNDVPAVASTSTFFASEPSLVAAASTGVETELLREQAPPLVDVATSTSTTLAEITTSSTLTPQAEQNELMKGVADGDTEAIAPPLGQLESPDQVNENLTEEEDSDDEDSEQGLDEEPTMVVITDAIYSAVPISSELHIFPHSSKGFNWNQDNFMKPHQRRNLGVDELHSAFNASVGGIVRSESSSSSSSTSSSDTTSGSSNMGDGMSAIRVHEIRLDQDETDHILPSHP